MKGTVSVGVIFISGYIANLAHCTLLQGLVVDPVVENVVHLQASNPPTGVDGKWRMKTIWTPRWIKEWKTAKVIKPVWKKVWTPYEIREWIPIPKPPPGWDDSTPLVPVPEEIPPWNPIPPYPSDGPGPGPESETEPTCTDCGYEYSKPEAGSTTSAPPAGDSSADSNQLPRYPPHTEELNLDMPMPSEFLIPPKFFPSSNFREKETVNNETSPVYRTISKEEYERPYQKEVSPYAVKLAQAVIQEKLNKLKSVGEKQTGLTEVVYRNETSQVSTTASPSTTRRSSTTQKTVKLSSTTTTTESSPKIFIVTPTTIKSNKS